MCNCPNKKFVWISGRKWKCAECGSTYSHDEDKAYNCIDNMIACKADEYLLWGRARSC